MNGCQQIYRWMNDGYRQIYMQMRGWICIEIHVWVSGGKDGFTDIDGSIDKLMDIYGYADRWVYQ